jgi:hypothetical protein
MSSNWQLGGICVGVLFGLGEGRGKGGTPSILPRLVDITSDYSFASYSGLKEKFCDALGSKHTIPKVDIDILVILVKC